MCSIPLNPARFTGTRVNIKRPVEIAFFSFDENRELKPFSTSSLRYYCPPFACTPHSPSLRPPVSLREGYASFKKFVQGDEHLDGLLDTLEVWERRNHQKVEADFVTWRGMITKLVTALYDDEGEIEMRATKFQGTIFIEEDHEAKRRMENAQRSTWRSRPGQPDNDEMAYWGYKFEALALLDRPLSEATRDDVEARESAVVENASQYCSIIRTEMGSNSLVIAGEVDGVMGYKPENASEPARWVELKTTRRPDNKWAEANFGKKMMRFWAQSFLIGCPTVILGYRSKDGILESVEELETQKLPTQAKHFSGSDWNANACLNCGAAILDMLKSTINEGGVWRVSKPSKAPSVSVSRLTEFGDGSGDILKPSFKAWRAEFDGLKGTGQ